MATLRTTKRKNIDPVQKSLVVFDLDGTLTESKQPMKRDMAVLLRKLLETRKVAVISGGKYELFKKHFLERLHEPKKGLQNLFLFPTSATSFYRFRNGAWRRVYMHALSPRNKKTIREAFRKAFVELHYVRPKKIYGTLIEDRGSEMTFSALGQHAPLKDKEEWTRKNSTMKRRLANVVGRHVPDLEVRAAGFTSIDVTHKGIDKAYGIRQIETRLKIPRRKMLFVGDALFKGGNDAAVLKTGVDAVAVKGPEETKRVIRAILNLSQR
jgi:HAD superfamily hydrolase (TIGR01484 family)